MKKTFTLLVLMLLSSYRLIAQDCGTVPPSDNRAYPWCYTPNVGTNWNTTQYKAFIINGMPFRLLYPKSYSTATSSTKYPLVILMHGIGEKGTDNNLQLKLGGKEHLDNLNAGNYEGFVMVPQSPNQMWSTSHRAHVMAFINYAISNLKVDPFRVQMEGYSSGGTATWELATQNPLVFAGIIPMSAANNTIAGYAENLKYTAVMHSQGGRDTNPTPAAGNYVASRFNAVGANYQYYYYPDLGHGTWNTMYRERDFFRFLMRNSMLRIHVLHFKYNFCSGETIAGTMGVKQGFEAYEWRKNGVLISGANANQLNFSSLGSYTVRIKHRGVWSQWSEPQTIQQIAPTPTPTIVATGPTALPSLDGRTTVTLRAPKGYQAYKWSNNSTLDSLVVKTSGSYSVSVTAPAGCPSAFSAPIKVTYNAVGVLPAPTTMAVATSSETALTINWSDRSSNETGFEIYRRLSQDHPWVLAGQVSANRTSFLDSGLQAFTRYQYAVRSVNADGGSTYLYGSGKTGTDAAAPTAPANLEVVKTNRSSIGLQWQPATDNADGQGSITYQVYSNNKSTLVGTTTGTSFTVRDLPAQRVYNFSVQAVDQLGNKSEFSNQITAGTYYNGLSYTYYEGNIATVHDISLLTPLKAGIIPNFNISTHRNKNDYFAFKFEGFINIPTSGTYTFYTTSNDGSTLTINGTEVVNNNGRHSSQERSGTISLTAGYHEIKVLYFEYIGSGETLSVRWQGPGITKQLIPDAAFKENFTQPRGPATPGSVTATALDHQRITLRWADNSTNESGFEILRSTSNNGTFAVVKTVNTNTTQYTDTELKASTTYYYKIRAINSSGESAYAGLNSGTWVNAKTAAGSTSLPAPSALTAYRTSNTSAQLKWTDNTYNETGFEVWRSTNGVNFSRLVTTGANINTFSDNNISTSTSFQYRVRAINGGSSSGFSNTTALSTQNRPPVIRGIASVVSAPESRTTEVFFDLSDPEGTPIQLSTRYLPHFARVERVSATRGKIVLTPSVKDLGYYSGIQLTASDGVLETDITFGISIKDNQKTSVYVNMGQNSVAPAPWNNTNTWGGVSNRVVLSNMRDENGTATGYSLTLIDPWSNSKPYGETSENDSGIYPDVVTNSAYIINPSQTVRFKVSGLRSGQRYNFVFFGSSIFKSNNGNTRYTIGGQSVSLAVQSNIDKTVQINGIRPDANGEVVISVTGASDATKGGYLNAFVLEQYPDNGQILRPGRFTAQAVSKSQVDLSWTDNSYQETGFEIWRRVLPSGSFTKITTTAANTTAYTDRGVSANTAYEYKLRAVNGSSSFSAYSDTKQAATLQYQVLINAEYGSGAPSPWNNLAQRPTDGYTWYNFKSDAGARTGINLRLDQSFDGNNNFGPDAGGMGIYPNQVIKSFYFNEVGTIAKLRFYGLNDELTYNFRFFASSAFGTENGVTEYRIGSRKATLDVQQNLKNTAVIRDLQPSNGTVTLEVEAGDFARYGYLSAVVIEAREGYKEANGANANARHIEDEEVATLQADELSKIAIYPNPTEGELFVDYVAETAGPCYLQVMDITGRQIHNQEVFAHEGNNTFELDLSNNSVSKGMYLLRIKSDGFESKVIRFIKQ